MLPQVTTKVFNLTAKELYEVTAHTGDPTTVWAKSEAGRVVVLERFQIWGEDKFREKK